MVPDLFNVMSSDAAYEKTSAVGTVPDFVEFTGIVAEISPTQEYDKQYVFTEYAAKIQIQRKLAADDQYRVMSRYPKNLANSASRSREKLGASIFDLAFTYTPTDGDAVSLCNSAHPSNVAGVASQSNTSSTALSATQIETLRIAMAGFRDDIGELTPSAGDTIIAPRALESTGWEIINSKGKVDTANNNANFHQGKYKLVVWDRLTDTNNFFMTNYDMEKEYLIWWNREPNQFFKDEDSNTMVAIYLGYFRVGTGWDDFLKRRDHLKQGELLGTPNGTISSQASEGISMKVQRLEAETRNVSNASTSALPRNRIINFLDDIVCSA